MSIGLRHLNQDVTHWSIAGSDGFGGYTFGTPAKLAGRWEDKAVMFLDTSGEEVVSNAIVYVDSDIEVGDYLALGDQTGTSDPTTLDKSYKIRQFHKSTDLRAVASIRKAML